MDIHKIENGELLDIHKIVFELLDIHKIEKNELLDIHKIEKPEKNVNYWISIKSKM